MNRRSFVWATAAGAAAWGRKTHIVTLSFDDGLRDSFYKTADIYERFGLRACFNVIALGHEEGFRPLLRGQPDPGIVPFVRGDFEDWNRLKKRGHEVMAHTYNHVNLTERPLEESKELITRCADYFAAHLEGFRAADSVYSFAYNASNGALDEYALTKFLAVRTRGETPVNPIPRQRRGVRIGCWSHGPENCDAAVEASLSRFLASEGGWFVFNTHGLDKEGWGPMSAKYLTSLLGRLTRMEQVEVLPAGEVVQRLGS